MNRRTYRVVYILSSIPYCSSLFKKYLVLSLRTILGQNFNYNISNVYKVVSDSPLNKKKKVGIRNRNHVSLRANHSVWWFLFNAFDNRSRDLNIQLPAVNTVARRRYHKISDVYISSRKAIIFACALDCHANYRYGWTFLQHYKLLRKQLPAGEQAWTQELYSRRQISMPEISWYPWHAKRDKILTTISHEFVIRLVKNWWSGRVSEEKYIMEVHDCLLLADQSSSRWAHYIEIHRTKITIRQVISIVQLQVICKRPREAEPCFNWCGFYDKRENSYYYWRSRFELKLQE